MLSFSHLPAVRSLSKRPFPSGGLSSLVQAIYEKRKILEASGKTRLQVIASLDLMDSFWSTYSTFEAETFKNFEADFPKGFNLLSDLMSDLVRYHKLSSMPDWKDNPERVVTKMEELVQRYFSLLISQQKKDKGAIELGSSTNMSPHDWAGVWGSLLLLSYSKTFNERFGQEKIIFEGLAQQAYSWIQDQSADSKTDCRNCGRELSKSSRSHSDCHSCSVAYVLGHAKTKHCGHCCRVVSDSRRCNSCHWTTKYAQAEPPLDPWYDAKGQLLPYKPDSSVSAVRIVAPKSFSDPSHIAHIVWKFCHFLESLETKKQTRKQEAAIEVTTEDDESWEMK